MEKLLQIAMVCHEANCTWCAANGDTTPPHWENAPDWQRRSAVDGVMFHLTHPNTGPEASHENWRKQKRAEGWVFGEVKDPEKKTHPCMVDFSELPEEQQQKDRLFRAIVHSFLRYEGFPGN